MNFKEFFSLKEYNTFNVDIKSVYSFFCYYKSELIKFSKTEVFKNNKKLILGGGSNVLFLNDFEGLAIIMENKGVEITYESDKFVYLKVASGEVWDDFVSYCVENNYGGVENLSLIPGTVGASPIQNIGAYGVEAKDVIIEVEALEIETSEIKTFYSEDCNFGYRDSIFKNELKDKYIILYVSFKLSKVHELNLSYGNISEILIDIEDPSIKDVRKAVIEIRESKLPDVNKLPNAGSFFKNPVVDVDFYDKLKSKHPDLVSYPFSDGKVKLAAGQLIDKCGWKGKKESGVGVHENQALVIVNYDNSTGNEILKFSEKVQKSVSDAFGVNIEREVTVVE